MFLKFPYKPITHLLITITAIIHTLKTELYDNFFPLVYCSNEGKKYIKETVMHKFFKGKISDALKILFFYISKKENKNQSL